jgi:hypothetical protein
MQSIKMIIVFLLLSAGFACRELYKPDLISSPNAYLVIEGILNAGNGPTAVRLTRTFKLDDTAKVKGESNAMVLVEGKDNTTRQLIMDGDGIYKSPGLNLVLKNEYRLRIITANGKEYLSDYVVAKNTPPIDSLGFIQDDKGVKIHVSTHDDSGGTRYYYWDYDETWEIRTYYFSDYKYLNGQVVSRFPGDYVNVCWKYGNSGNILIGSSASLQSDNIFRATVAFFGNGDEKLDVRYSILLRQYALDKQGYEFYEMMKKNTESLGTIFDAQPLELKGNIRCTSDPNELVIGYVSAAVVEQKRFFISAAQLSRWNFYEECLSINVRNHPDSIMAAHSGGLSFYGAIGTPFITHYLASFPACVDCTERGGSLVKPSYW